MLSNLKIAALIMIAPLCSLAAPVFADDSGEAKKCIQISQISNARVIDSQNIRFEMRGGPDYMNTLPYKCIGLSKNDPFMYETSLSRLCDLDTITVLQRLGGGYSKGASCGLGKFVPIAEDE